MDNVGGTTYSTPAVADIDNDGTDEIIFPPYGGRIEIYNWTGSKTGS